MNRGNFLKLLATIVVAPSVLITEREPAAIFADINEVGLWEPSAVTMAARYNAVYWKITEEMTKDPEYMHFLLKDPRSDLWKRAAERGVDMGKPCEVRVGFDRDDFVQNALTMVVRQPKPTDA